MANTKGYSVSRTDASGSGVSSAVYSYSGIPGTSWHCGRNGAYDHIDPDDAFQQGRVPTLANGEKAPATATNVVKEIKTVTVGSTERAGLKSTEVQCTTTTTKGNGAGLIVKFTTDSDGKVEGTKGDYTIVDKGDGYVTDDTVTIDGWPGAILQVTDNS